MKADQARVRDLLTQTITLMCRNGLEFSHNLRVEGLLAVTVDGSDIFVIHMDEKVTDRPSYAAGFHCTESLAGRQHGDSPSCATSDADEPADRSHDNLLTTYSSARVAADAERSTDGHVTNAKTVRNESESEGSPTSYVDDVQHSVKTEAIVEDSDNDDVMIVESDVRALANSSIPLPVLQGMNDCEDGTGSPCATALSPISKRRRMNHRRTSFADVQASIGNTSDDQPGVADMWSGSALCASHSDMFHHTNTYDMLPHTSFLSANGSQALTSGSNVPVNTLASRVVREALVQFVVEPLIFKAGRSVVAFRVTWRHNNPVELDKAWLGIHQRRQMCDDLVSRQPDVDFFFSCITGLYNKACSRTIASAFGVFPSISYYVVGDVQETVINSMRCSLFGGELKLITGRPANSTVNDMVFLSAPLYIVLKDHSSKYVKQQLIRSWQATNNNLSDLENGVLSLPIAKLMIVNFKLTGVISNAYDALKVAAPSFVVHLEHTSS